MLAVQPWSAKDISTSSRIWKEKNKFVWIEKEWADPGFGQGKAPVKLSQMLPMARSRIIETNAGLGAGFTLGLGPWKLYQTIKYTGIFSPNFQLYYNYYNFLFLYTERFSWFYKYSTSEIWSILLDYFADIYCCILARGLEFTWGPRPLANMTFLKRVSFCFYEYLLLKFWSVFYIKIVIISLFLWCINACTNDN